MTLENVMSLRFHIFALEAFPKVEEAVVETVEEKYVPHIQPPIQPLSWAEVGKLFGGS